MRVILQRVSRASLSIEQRLHASIGPGLVVLAGFNAEDQPADLDWMAHKLTHLRIFNDAAGVMNLSLKDSGGDLLAVSQFTLHASTRRGNRPSWSRAAPAAISQPLFAAFVSQLEQALGRPVASGVFGADMQIELVNDGPVTLQLDSRQVE